MLHKVLSWVTPDKEKTAESQPVAEATHFRRSSRLRVALPVTLSGHDELGEGFEEKTEVLDISKTGVKILTIHQLASASEISISNPATGLTCLSKIVWRSATARLPGNAFETGVEVLDLLDAERVWGIESPPADWIESSPPPTADQRLEYLCQRARSEHPTIQSPAESKKVFEDGGTVSDFASELKMTLPGEFRARPVPTASTGTDGFKSAESLMPGIQETKAEAKPGRQPIRAKGKLTLLGLDQPESATRVVPETTASAFQEMAGQAETPQPPKEEAPTELPSSPQRADLSVGSNGSGHEPSAPAVEATSHSAEASPGPPPDQIERTLHEVQREVQQKVLQEVAMTSSGIEEASAGESAPQSMPGIEELSDQLRASGQEVANQVREQLAHMTYKSLEILTQKAKATTEESRGQITKELDQSLKSLEILAQKAKATSEEYRNQLSKELDQCVSQSTDAASASIRRATEESVAKLEANWQESETSLGARVEQRFAELATSASAELGRQSETLVASLQGRLDGALEDFERKAMQRLQEVSNRITSEFEKSWSQQAERQTTAMAERLGEKLRVVGSAVVDEANNELAATTKTSLEAVTQATAKECHSVLDRIFREQSETVSGAADSALTSIKRGAGQALSDLRNNQEQMTGSFTAIVQESQRGLSDQASQGIAAVEQKASALVSGFEARLGKTLANFEQKAASELSELLRKTAADRREESARLLEVHALDTERKLKEGLTTSGQGVVEEARKLGGITQKALEQLSQTAAEECRKRIEEFRYRSLAVQKEVDALNRSSLERIQHEVAPARKTASSRRAFNVTLGVLVACVAVPVVGILYLSTRPVMRLRPEPPAAFADTNPKWNAKRAAVERQLARAYWDSAVQNVQQIYHFGTRLPTDPPAGFQIDPEAVVSSGVEIDVAASRARYWQKFREAWSQPEAWVESEGWNTEWLSNLGSSPSQGGAAAASSSSPAAARAPSGGDR